MSALVMRWLRRAALGLGVAALGACGSDFDPGSRVTTFRILAVSAKKVVTTGCPMGQTTCLDPKGGSWAKPGDTVELDALWEDPQQRSTMWAWATCENPPSSTVVGCFIKLAQDLQKTGGDPAAAAAKFAVGKDLDVFRLNIRPDILTSPPLSPEGLKGAMVGVVIVGCPGELAQNPNHGPTDLPFQCKENGTGRVMGPDEYVAGIKRVFVRTTDTNADPIIGDVTFDGTSWGKDDVRELDAACDPAENRFDRCDDAGKHTITVTVDPASFESGVDQFGQPFTEEVIVQYYATEGLFEYDVKRAQDTNTRFAGRRTKTGEQKVWIVVRDNRGGVNWLERRVRIK